VAHATLVSNQGKVGIVRRVLVGLGALGVGHVVAMPDSDRLAARAHAGLQEQANVPDLTILEMPLSGEAGDSEQAARLMRALGVRCIVALGGDGTARAVSKGAGETPLVLISTGTNNVLPSFVEGTVAGLAAAAVAQGLVSLRDVALRHKWFAVERDAGPDDRALVDIALVRGRFVGARAVWDMADVRQILVTRADPASIGISAIAAMVHPVTPAEPVGLCLRLAADAPRRVLAAIGPGLVTLVGIAAVRLLQPGECIEHLAEEPLIVALDGEREMLLRQGQSIRFTLRQDGPWIVDVPRVMRALVSSKEAS
jgi:predicted polyphosphate/ATP-dependent NAD kinase